MRSRWSGSARVRAIRRASCGSRVLRTAYPSARRISVATPRTSGSSSTRRIVPRASMMRRPCRQAFERSAGSRTRRMRMQNIAEIAFARMITTPLLGDSAHLVPTRWSSASRLTPEIESSLDRKSKSGWRKIVLCPYPSPVTHRRFASGNSSGSSSVVGYPACPAPPCMMPPVRFSDIYVASPAHPWARPQGQCAPESGEDNAERAQCPSLPTIPKAGMRQMCEGLARLHTSTRILNLGGWGP